MIDGNNHGSGTQYDADGIIYVSLAHRLGGAASSHVRVEIWVTLAIARRPDLAGYAALQPLR